MKDRLGKKLVIAGDASDTDDYAAELRRMANNDPDIIFTGFVSGDELYEIYSNAYAVCLASDMEGMAMGLLEALAYGNAVLCSDIPENTSVAEENAVYFVKGDRADLAEKLEFMCAAGAEEVQRLKNTSEKYIRESTTGKE